MKDHYGFVMMVKEKYWIGYRDRHDDGTGFHAYVTRGAAAPKNADVLLFYVSAPVKAICGHARFVERRRGSPDVLWNELSDESVLKSRRDYDRFVGDSPSVSFVRFTDLCDSANPIPLKDLLLFFGAKRLSRKGFYVGKDATRKLVSMMGSGE
jgi:predicted transcriptional regulator